MSLPGHAARWWIAWLIVCVPAGAAAGWGYVEFYPRYPSGGYDGGFAGDLLLFGGMMALAQAPFVGVFSFATAQTRNFTVYLTGIPMMVSWILAGFIGWTLGSFVDVWLDLPYRSFSSFYDVFGRSVRWFVMGILQGIVFAAACFTDSSHREARAVGGRALFSALILAWAIASFAGGFVFEMWAEFDSGYGVGSVLGTGDAVEDIARYFGATFNIADIVVPFATMLPLLYGPFTGAVIFFAVRRMQRLRNSP